MTILDDIAGRVHTALPDRPAFTNLALEGAGVLP